MEKSIRGIHDQINVKPSRYSQIIIEDISADNTMVIFCRNSSVIDHICISTPGVARFRRILVSNTGYLITKSLVFVLAVPIAYRIADMKSVLYATDLSDYMKEMKQVVS